MPLVGERVDFQATVTNTFKRKDEKDLVLFLYEPTITFIKFTQHLRRDGEPKLLYLTFIK